MDTKAYYKKWREEHRQQGLCIRCVAPALRDSFGRPKSLCKIHSERQAVRNELRRQTWKELRLCQKCGHEPFKPGASVCRPCLDRQLNAMRRKRSLQGISN